MSLIHVLSQVGGLLRDPTNGLGAKVALAAANAGVTQSVRTDFVFPDWTLSENTKPTMQPLVTVIPTGWSPEVLAVNPQRDARVTLDIGYECFDSDPQAIKASIAIVSAALTEVIDGLVSYSSHMTPIVSTIVLVFDPLTFSYGSYPGKGRGGQPTTNGFICSVTLLERSRNGT